MALSEKSRTTVYTAFTEWLGEEAAAEMMSQFSLTEGDEVVTRSFLRAELAELRGELRGEMADLRGELRGEMADLRGEMGDLRNELRGEMGDLRTEMHASLRRQTQWLAGLMVTGLGVSAVVAQAVG
ncbi:MAG: hypothetical protein U5R31_05115 [Acidimicrobiia bacterium]|nr:hypothetical protein [Acidimicrobiia bacterium]